MGLGFREAHEAQSREPPAPPKLGPLGPKPRRIFSGLNTYSTRVPKHILTIGVGV